MVAALRELLSELPVVTPADHIAEARQNTCSLTRDASETATTDEIVDALQAVAGAWLDSTGHHVGATFYAWYDEQAGQLRLSLSSSGADDLPFSSTIRLVDPQSVVSAFLGDPHPGTILWEEFEPADGWSAPDEALAPPLAVWALGSQ